VRFPLGQRAVEVGPGDCVAARIDRPTRLEAVGAEAAEYLVIAERAGR
jgi:mannose-6-phosphate isomerase-like protein (cupin superfamily)